LNTINPHKTAHVAWRITAATFSAVFEELSHYLVSPEFSQPGQIAL